MIQVMRSPTLPWASVDAVDSKYEDAHLPFPSREEVDKCMNCTRERCINCLDPSASNRGTGRPCGRPRKNRAPIDGQRAIVEISAKLDVLIDAVNKISN